MFAEGRGGSAARTRSPPRVAKGVASGSRAQPRSRGFAFEPLRLVFADVDPLDDRRLEASRASEPRTCEPRSCQDGALEVASQDRSTQIGVVEVCFEQVRPGEVSLSQVRAREGRAD